MPEDSTTLFTGGAFSARRLVAADVPAVQAFLDANPEYYFTVGGEPPRRDEAQRDFDERPPAGLAFADQWVIGFHDAAGSLAAYAVVVMDFVAAGVWHLGFFIVATALHGSGSAHVLYQALEDWMRAQGARWLRLGVVQGNTRAERFWFRLGYTELRRREGIPMGQRMNTVRVLMKPLSDATAEGYLARVPRDRPDSLLP